MVTHPAHAFHAHVPALVPPVVACVGDPFYKITSEALLVTQQLVKVGVESAVTALSTCLIFFGGFVSSSFCLLQVIRPLDNQSEGSDSFDPSPYINDLFTCTIKRLKAADIDQEVKERAISSMGQIICNLGNILPAIAWCLMSSAVGGRFHFNLISFAVQAIICRTSFQERC